MALTDDIDATDPYWSYSSGTRGHKADYRAQKVEHSTEARRRIDNCIIRKKRRRDGELGWATVHQGLDRDHAHGVIDVRGRRTAVRIPANWKSCADGLRIELHGALR
jgi:hypothetical protein